MSTTMEDIFGPVISSYSRAEAIEDGVLIDVTKQAKEAGFNCPVAVTAAVWSEIRNIPATYIHEDVSGRLWDVLWMCRLAARRGGEVIRFTLCLHTENDRRKSGDMQLKAVAWPGDDMELVVTIMLPNED